MEQPSRRILDGPPLESVETDLDDDALASRAMRGRRLLTVRGVMDGQSRSSGGVRALSRAATAHGTVTLAKDAPPVGRFWPWASNCHA